MIAYLTMTGKMQIALWLVLPSVLPFWRELYDSGRLFLQFGKRFLHISTKKEKRS
jgi:hypothetical protein